MKIIYLKQHWKDTNKTIFTSIRNSSNMDIYEVSEKLRHILDGIATIKIPSEKILFQNVNSENVNQTLKSIKKDLRKNFYRIHSGNYNSIIYIDQNKALKLIAYDEEAQCIKEYS